jgi:hypothetical protein
LAYRPPGLFKSLDRIKKYNELIDDLLALKKYPVVDGIAARSVIQWCWTGGYSDLGALIEDQSSQLEVVVQESK